MLDTKKYVQTNHYYDHRYRVHYDRSKVKKFTGTKLPYGHRIFSNPKWYYWDGPLYTLSERKLERYIYRVCLKFIGEHVDDFYKFLENRLHYIPWHREHFARPSFMFCLNNGIIQIRKD